MGMSLGLVWGFPWKKRSLGRCRGRVKRRKGDNLVAPEICLDLLMEILARLPSKSLMRFKCVSKLWFSLIRSRFFSNRYSAVASPPRPTRRVYMSFMEHIYCESMDLCPKPRNSLLQLFSSSSSSSKFDKDSNLPGMGGRINVVFRGLLLYNVCRKACIYNPTTRQRVILPIVESNIFAQDEFCKNVGYFFGYDPVLDQYKILCTVVISSEKLERITSEHWVFVLEAGGFWKRIEFDQPHAYTRPGLCIDGVLYYLAATSLSRDILVSFDVRTEEFGMIKTPHAVSPSLGGGYVGFVEYGGKPVIVDYTHLKKKGLVDLWALEDGDKWLKKSQVLQPCQMHLVDDDIDLLMESATQNGQIVFAPREWHTPYYFLYYDLQKNDLSKVNVEVSESDPWFSTSYFCSKHMDKSESIMHLEI